MTGQDLDGIFQAVSGSIILICYIAGAMGVLIALIRPWRKP